MAILMFDGFEETPQTTFNDRWADSNPPDWISYNFAAGDTMAGKVFEENVHRTQTLTLNPESLSIVNETIDFQSIGRGLKQPNMFTDVTEMKVEFAYPKSRHFYAEAIDIGPAPPVSIILAVDALKQAEQEYPDAVDLIGPWMEAIHRNDPEGFYDELAEINVPRIAIPPELSQGEDYIETISYDEICESSQRAIDVMYKSLLVNYNTDEVKDIMSTNEVVSCKKVDAGSVMLTLVPRKYNNE